MTYPITERPIITITAIGPQYDITLHQGWDLEEFIEVTYSLIEDLASAAVTHFGMEDVVQADIIEAMAERVRQDNAPTPGDMN